MHDFGPFNYSQPRESEFYRRRYNSPGVRDTKVSAVDFCPFFLDQCTGMIHPGNQQQFQHFPKIGDNTDRYDRSGPHFHPPRAAIL